MHPLVWFLIVLALSVVYGTRIRVVVGRVKSPLLHWWVAISMVGSLVIGTLLATRMQVQVPRDAGVAIHAAVLFVCAWLGMRYWVAWKPWDIPAAAGALALVGVYFTQPQRYNNLMLAALALGMAVGGYYVTKRWLRAFFILMAVFDAYMVWWSDIADELARGQTGLFPSSLVIGMFRLPFLEIGTLDVALSALAVVGIQRHRGGLRSLLFSFTCGSSVFGIAWGAEHGLRGFTEVPFLVVLAPLVWLFLVRFRKPDPQKS